jgi:hypothetical protein
MTISIDARRPLNWTVRAYGDLMVCLNPRRAGWRLTITRAGEPLMTRDFSRATEARAAAPELAAAVREGRLL